MNNFDKVCPNGNTMTANTSDYGECDGCGALVDRDELETFNGACRYCYQEVLGVDEVSHERD